MLRKSSTLHTLVTPLTCGCLLGALMLLCLTFTHFQSSHHKVFLPFSFLALFSFSLWILWRETKQANLILTLLLPLAIAFFIRGLCMDHQTHDYTTFLANWAAFFRDNGGWSALSLPKGDYNVPYLYFMALISYIPVDDLYMIKLFSILFDVLLAWSVLKLVRHFTPSQSTRPAIAFTLTLLLPTVILNGAYWGQCDSLYSAFCLHALAFALERKPKLSVCFIAIAFSFKLQTVFILPLWGVLWILKYISFKQLFLFPITYLATILPALLTGKPLLDILGIYLNQTTQYNSRLTLNAPSIYALIPHNKVVDTTVYAQWGIFAAFTLVALLLLFTLINRQRLSAMACLKIGVLMTIGIPLLLPHMHDRYFFIADVLSLAIAFTLPFCVPQAIAVQIASLGAYHAYLRLQYAFPMAYGTYLLLFSLGTYSLLFLSPKYLETHAIQLGLPTRKNSK